MCTGVEVGVAAGAAEGGKALGTAAAIAAEDAAMGAAFGSMAGGLSGASTLAAIGAAETAAIAGLGGASTMSGAFSTLKDVSTVLSPISSLMQVGQAMSAADKAGKLTGAPQVTGATPMPTGNTIPATRASIAEQLTRRGRAATILTSPAGEKLGA